jgi:hypothetical protein
MRALDNFTVTDTPQFDIPNGKIEVRSPRQQRDDF